ncbi:MAG: sodium:calcium antiporter, partial [Planctomycetota bacterium]
LALGAKMTVYGAEFVGRKIGLSDAVIGLTMLALGTSLPELATCIVASIKAQHDISIGNLVGSNIFNTLLVTGTAGTFRPFEVAKRLGAGNDYWIMIAVSFAFALFAVIGRRTISRLAGSVLLIIYIVYIFCLFFFGK